MNSLQIHPRNIHKTYQNIWYSIRKNIDVDYFFSKLNNEIFNNLVIYDILDGTRTTLTENVHFKIRKELEVPYYCLSLLYTLSVLGAKSCVFLVHTSYNRKRGKIEFERMERVIKKSYKPFKKFLKKHLIRFHCLCLNSSYECIDLLEDLENETKGGTFDAFFIFDYDEEWIKIGKGAELIDILPEIDVFIRHTKFQPSGGWIPGKMKKSSFLYSQNGTTFSNWNLDEIVSLACIALLSKLLNVGESLDKIYPSSKDVYYRYEKRELNLFEKVIYLSKNPQKLCITGSPIGPLRIYY
ncbi:MAG: hypothetical protein GF329_04160 [Candidatus Lokiarchaeota archaeon]|nr:hypothetical protein [Candidatus Lokiarchaeota archaeon]